MIRGPFAFASVLAMTALLSGCATVYTDISAIEGGRFAVTRAKVGAFGYLQSALYVCTASPDGQAMKCELVAEPE